MVIVAVTLLSMPPLLCLLAWGLIRIAIRNRGRLVIESKAAAILLKITFRVEYHPPSPSDALPGSTAKAMPEERVIEPPGRHRSPPPRS
jgi:hypothetical protein